IGLRTMLHRTLIPIDRLEKYTVVQFRDTNETRRRGRLGSGRRSRSPPAHRHQRIPRNRRNDRSRLNNFRTVLSNDISRHSEHSNRSERNPEPPGDSQIKNAAPQAAPHTATQRTGPKSPQNLPQNTEHAPPSLQRSFAASFYRPARARVVT